MVANRVVQAFLRLESGRSLQGFGVVQRQHVQQYVGHNGVGSPDERLAAASALLEVEPHYRRFFALLKGRRNLAHPGATEPGYGCGRSAELYEISAAVTFLLH